jgi:RNA polymerase sigma factor (sigma-70 family)
MPQNRTVSGFPQTTWSLIVAAADHGNAQCDRALERICSGYWRPIYLYVRSRGHSPELAEDLTQGFFARLIEKNYLADFRQARGRFRSFLLSAVKHYLANEYDRTTAAKRGGEQQHITIDWTEDGPEHTFLKESIDVMTPETLFAREWGRTVLAKTRRRIQTEMERAGKKNHFDLLMEHATGDEEVSYRQIAASLGMTKGAIRVAVHRLRRRFRELLQDEVGQTLLSADELDDEIRFLFSALSKP